MYNLALVPINTTYIAPLKLTINYGSGALRTHSFSAAFWQIPATWSIFLGGRELNLTPGAFGFGWNAEIKNSYELAVLKCL